MEYVIMPRQSGRTTMLIEKCARNKNSVIVCPTRNAAESVYRRAHELNYVINKPITFKDFCCADNRGHDYTQYYIDDLDVCLSSLANGIPITSVTLDADTTELMLHQAHKYDTIDKKDLKQDAIIWPKENPNVFTITYEMIFKDFKDRLPYYAVFSSDYPRILDDLDYRPGPKPYTICIWIRGIEFVYDYMTKIVSNPKEEASYESLKNGFRSL